MLFNGYEDAPHDGLILGDMIWKPLAKLSVDIIVGCQVEGNPGHHYLAIKPDAIMKSESIFGNILNVLFAHLLCVGPPFLPLAKGGPKPFLPGFSQSFSRLPFQPLAPISSS